MALKYLCICTFFHASCTMFGINSEINIIRHTYCFTRANLVAVRELARDVEGSKMIEYFLIGPRVLGAPYVINNLDWC